MMKRKILGNHSSNEGGSPRIRLNIKAKVGTKLLLLFAGCLLALLVVVITFVNVFNSHLLTEDFLKSSEYNVIAIEQMEERMRSETAAIAEGLSLSGSLVTPVEEGDTTAIHDTFASHASGGYDLLVLNANLDAVYCGNNMLQTVERDAEYIRDAQNGRSKSVVDVLNGDQIAIISVAPLSAAAPGSGVIVVCTLISNQHELDLLKESSGAEYTIFHDNMRMATTIELNGVRQVGTTMGEGVYKQVITEGKDYTGETKINGVNYAVKYKPLTDHDGKVIGALFSGRSLAGIEKQILTLIITTSFIALLLFAGIALTVRFALSRMIVRPLERLVEIAAEIALGRLDCSEDYGYNLDDEVGTLYGSQMDILHTLQKNIGEIHDASQIVTSSAAEISANSEAMAQGASEQASSLEELNASLETVYNNVKANAENAREASDLASQVGIDVNRGNEKMQQLITAMGEISSSSNQISKIIKTIDDIAFQTNILALNAAVEAARAGAAGKGFAVVADEVRNLAQKSAEAAQNTTDLIQSSISAVEAGTQKAGETSKYMESVVTGVSDVVIKIGNISAASEDQASAMGQIHIGLDQISSVVQTNSASAEESAATSQELSTQANRLNDQVAKFRLKSSEVRL